MKNCNRRHKKKAKEKCLIKGRRENEEQVCHHKGKEAHKIIMNKKKLYIKNIIESNKKNVRGGAD